VVMNRQCEYGAFRGIMYAAPIAVVLWAIVIYGAWALLS